MQKVKLRITTENKVTKRSSFLNTLLFPGTDLIAMLPSQKPHTHTRTHAHTHTHTHTPNMADFMPLTSSHSTPYVTEAGSVKLSLHLRHRSRRRFPKPVLKTKNASGGTCVRTWSPFKMSIKRAMVKTLNPRYALPARTHFSEQVGKEIHTIKD